MAHGGQWDMGYGRASTSPRVARPAPPAVPVPPRRAASARLIDDALELHQAFGVKLLYGSDLPAGRGARISMRSGADLEGVVDIHADRFGPPTTGYLQAR